MTEPPQLQPPAHHLLLEKPKVKMHMRVVAFVVLAVFIVVGAIGIISRASDEKSLKKSTDAHSMTIVSVISAQAGADTEDVVLPGTVEAWHEATVYGRTAGYLKSWKYDIGAHVKEGDILAEIDAPDLDAEFHQAQADLNTAIANDKLAQITAKRWIELLKTDSVSKQDTDTKIATAEADDAMVLSAKANLDHLQQEEDFKNVVAPFDGVITQRYTDIGALINGGSLSPASSSTSGSSASSTTSDSLAGATTNQNLFEIADTSKLRVYVKVPETYTNAVVKDLHAELHVPQHPQQVFPALLSRSANALDPTTRTLLIELEVDNADGMLFAGGYTDVHIKMPMTSGTIILPVNALLFRDGMHVGVVTNNHVALKAVTIGRDFGKTVEIVNGLNVGDSIVINPPDSLVDGQEVRIQQAKDTNQDTKKDTKKDTEESDKQNIKGSSSADQNPTTTEDKNGNSGKNDKNDENEIAPKSNDPSGIKANP